MSMIYNIDDLVYDDIFSYPYDHYPPGDEYELLEEDRGDGVSAYIRYPPPSNVIYYEMDVEETVNPNDIEREDDLDGEQVRLLIESGHNVFATPPPSDDEDENPQDEVNNTVALHDNP